mgnify:CR=1 FL=1
MEPVGIKETKEVIAAVVLLKDAVVKIAADGKIGFDDAAAVVELAGHAKELTDAVEGFNQVGAELKNLDASEAKELLILLIDGLLPKKA